MRRLFRVLPFIHPPSLIQTILPPGKRHELPHPARARLGYSLRLKSAFGLGEIDQVFRHPLLAQGLLNHGAVSPGAAEAGFDDRAPARALEIIQVGQHLIIHCKRKIVRYGRNLALGASAEVGSNFSGWGMGSSAISSIGAGVAFCSRKPSPSRNASSSSELTVSTMW